MNPEQAHASYLTFSLSLRAHQCAGARWCAGTRTIGERVFAGTPCISSSVVCGLLKRWYFKSDVLISYLYIYSKKVRCWCVSRCCYWRQEGENIVCGRMLGYKQERLSLYHLQGAHDKLTQHLQVHQAIKAASAASSAPSSLWSEFTAKRKNVPKRFLRSNGTNSYVSRIRGSWHGTKTQNEPSSKPVEEVNNKSSPRIEVKWSTIIQHSKTNSEK